MEKCPICGKDFDERKAAISRIDNKTRICSDCSVKEAFNELTQEEIQRVLNKQE